MTEIQGKSILVRVNAGSSYRESTVLCYNASIFRLYHSTVTRVIVSSGLTTSKKVKKQKLLRILSVPLEQHVGWVSVQYFFSRLRNQANSINVLKTTLFDFFYSNELNRPKKDSLKKE